MAQMVKNPPALWSDPWVGVGMAIHSSILAWRIPMNRGAWQATVHGVTKSWTERLSTAQHLSLAFAFTPR